MGKLGKHRTVRFTLGSICAIVALAVIAVGWSAFGPRGAHAASAASDRLMTVMTQNMDEGTDFGSLLSATTPPQFVTAVTNVWVQVQATNPPARAAAVAREIALARPALVGLQEAAIWRTGTTRPATTVVYDQVQLVLDALAQQGAHYALVAVTTNADLEAPTAFGYDVRLTDENALLARTDLPTSELKLSNVQSRTFATNVTFTNPILGTVTFPCSWIAVDAQVRGKTVRFVTTHLASGAPAVQLAQANELVQGPGDTTLPLVFAGDFNSNAEAGPEQTATYPTLIGDGYEDAWSIAHPGDPGYTWGLYLEDPLVTPTTPSERIDLVLVRNGMSVDDMHLVGDTAADRLPFGLTPSDHAGVVATLELP